MSTVHHYQSDQSNRSGSRGFSLIELMVVLVLIGIATAVIIPEMRGTYEDAVLRSTGRKLVDVFHLASSQAVTLNQPHRVHFDRKKGRYMIEAAPPDGSRDSGVLPPDVPGGSGDIDARITIEVRTMAEDPSTDGRDEGPAFVSGDDLGKKKRDDSITFYSDGTADQAEILLQDREGFRLGLRINPITARVQIIELERR